MKKFSTILTLFLLVNSGNIKSQCIADFTYTVQGTMVTVFPILDSFPDPPFNFLWDFGDGSPELFTPSPSHNYSSTGTFQICLYLTNTTGCTDSVCHPVSITSTSISELNRAGDFLVYPNPASKTFVIRQVDFSGFTYTLSDVTGKIFLAGESSGFETEINVSGIPSGLYFIHARNDFSTRKRIISLIH